MFWNPATQTGLISAESTSTHKEVMMKNNPAFIKKFWWVGIPIVLAGGVVTFLVIRKRAGGGGGAGGSSGGGSVPRPSQPALQPGTGGSQMIPVTVIKEPERYTYSGNPSSVINAPSMETYNEQGKILGWNVRDALQRDGAAIVQLQMNLDNRQQYKGLFDGNWKGALSLALSKVEIKNPAYNEIDWRQTLTSLGFKIKEPIPWIPNPNWDNKVTVDYSIGVGLDRHGRYYSVAIPVDNGAGSTGYFVSMFPDYATPEQITALQDKLNEKGYGTGLYLGKFNKDVRNALTKYYNDKVKNEQPVGYIGAEDNFYKQGQFKGEEYWDRIKWSTAIYKLGLATTPWGLKKGR